MACFCEEAAASCALRNEVGHCTSRMPRKSRPAARPYVLATMPPPTGITTVFLRHKTQTRMRVKG
eukprot:5670036-Pleurochrysis_carterae.AAC.2